MLTGTSTREHEDSNAPDPRTEPQPSPKPAAAEDSSPASTVAEEVHPRYIGQWAYRTSSTGHKVDLKDSVSVSVDAVHGRLVTLEWPAASLPVDDLYLILLDAGGKGNGFEDVMKFERSTQTGRLQLHLHLAPGVYECKFMADGKPGRERARERSADARVHTA